jgi:transposase-like protein
MANSVRFILNLPSALIAAKTRRTRAWAWERGGSVRSFALETSTKEEIIPIIRGNLARESHVMTDEANRYSKLGSEFAKHDAVDHSRGEYGYTDRESGVKVNTKYRWRLLFDFQARYEGRLPALPREAFAPLSGGVRFPI